MPEELVPGSLTDGDDGRVLESTLDGDGVVARHDAIEVTDALHAVLLADALGHRRRCRKHPHAVGTEHLR